jgi:phage shock protein A
MASDPEFIRTHRRIDRIENLVLRLLQAECTHAQAISALSAKVQNVSDTVKHLETRWRRLQPVGGGRPLR